MIVNDMDANDSFYVEAENDEEAYRKALDELGWWLATPEEIEEEEIWEDPDAPGWEE